MIHKIYLDTFISSTNLRWMTGDWNRFFYYIPTLLTMFLFFVLFCSGGIKKSSPPNFFHIVEEATPTTKKKGFLCFFDRVVLGISCFYVLIFREKWKVPLIKYLNSRFPSNFDPNCYLNTTEYEFARRIFGISQNLKFQLKF